MLVGTCCALATAAASSKNNTGFVNISFLFSLNGSVHTQGHERTLRTSGREKRNQIRNVQSWACESTVEGGEVSTVVAGRTFEIATNGAEV